VSAQPLIGHLVVRDGTTVISFGEPGDAALLGVVTLESLA
jgi:hypothetical protein